MKKEDGRWWTEIDGIKTSCGLNGRFIDVFIYALQRKYLRKMIAPVFCLLAGHQFHYHGFGNYICGTCGKKY